MKSCPEMKLCIEQSIDTQLYYVKCSVCEWEDKQTYEIYKDAERRMNLLLGLLGERK